MAASARDVAADTAHSDRAGAGGGAAIAVDAALPPANESTYDSSIFAAPGCPKACHALYMKPSAQQHAGEEGYLTVLREHRGLLATGLLLKIPACQPQMARVQLPQSVWTDQAELCALADTLAALVAVSYFHYNWARLQPLLPTISSLEATPSLC